MPKVMSTELLPELSALLANVASMSGKPVDPTLMPAAEGRAFSEEANARWNINLPAMDKVYDLIIPARADLNSEAINTLVLEPLQKKSGTIIFVHGGGFCFGSSNSHERCARVLAEKTGLTVILPNYRLAPENPFPSGLIDVIGVLRSLIHGEVIGLDGPVYFAGDSAGANIALAAMLHEIDAHRPLPQGALLFYGNYAMDFTTQSYQFFADGPGLTRDRMKRYWNWYHEHEDLSANALACPLEAPLQKYQKLPPLYLLAAGVDPLLSDTLKLHDKLRQLGRDDPLHIVKGVTHGFLQYTNELRKAEQALEDAAEALKAMYSLS